MKNTKIPRFISYTSSMTLAVVAMASITVGCDSPNDKPAKTNPEQIEKIEKIHANANDVSQEMKDYSFAQRAEFSAHFKAEIKAINQEIDQMSAKVEQSNDAAKAEAKPKLEALRVQVADLNKQLEAANSATESTWSNVKSGISNGYGKVKDGVTATRQWVSDKIAP